jgi:hypothetical protein
MKIRYYRTKLEQKDEDRFEMLAKLIDEEKEYDHLKPRLLHLQDRRSEGGYSFLSAIVVWE